MKFFGAAAGFDAGRGSSPATAAHYASDDEGSTVSVNQEAAKRPQQQASKTKRTTKQVGFDLQDIPTHSPAGHHYVMDEETKAELWYGEVDYKIFRALVRQQASDILEQEARDNNNNKVRRDCFSYSLFQTYQDCCAAVELMNCHYAPTTRVEPSEILRQSPKLAARLVQYVGEHGIGLEHRVVRMIAQCRSSNRRQMADVIFDLQEDSLIDDLEEQLRDASECISRSGLLFAQVRALALAESVARAAA